ARAGGPGGGVAGTSGRWPGGAGTGSLRPGGARPSAGAGTQVAAVPADVGAAAAAVGDQLGGGKGDAAQPATFYLVMPLVDQIWLPGACHTLHLRVAYREPGPTAGTSQHGGQLARQPLAL